MRRIDVIGIGIGVFLAGGILFLLLQGTGLDSASAGIWSQAILVGGLVGWVLTYVFRAVTNNLTYHQQRREYEDAAFQKRLESMTPEEIEQLQAEIDRERSGKQ